MIGPYQTHLQDFWMSGSRSADPRADRRTARSSGATPGAGSRIAAKGRRAPVELEVGDRTVRISNPDRVYFPARGETKLDLARYYLSVSDGVVRALRDRPCMLHRFPTV